MSAVKAAVARTHVARGFPARANFLFWFWLLPGTTRQPDVLHLWRNVPHLLTAHTSPSEAALGSCGRGVAERVSVRLRALYVHVHGYSATWGTMQHLKPLWEV